MATVKLYVYVTPQVHFGCPLKKKEKAENKKLSAPLKKTKKKYALTVLEKIKKVVHSTEKNSQKK
tara:strand:+ start:767 stop:961 length:195 start_codon:yes stop_codon:yes gene_type:complete